MSALMLDFCFYEGLLCKGGGTISSANTFVLRRLLLAIKEGDTKGFANVIRIVFETGF
jgi:hypothetical protein